jgi:hypothetical protein
MASGFNCSRSSICSICFWALNDWNVLNYWNDWNFLVLVRKALIFAFEKY